MCAFLDDIYFRIDTDCMLHRTALWRWNDSLVAPRARLCHTPTFEADDARRNRRVSVLCSVIQNSVKTIILGQVGQELLAARVE